MASEKIGLVRAQDAHDLVARPDVKFALLALRVGVERGAERASLGRHLACQPGDRLLRTRAEDCVARAMMREREEFEKLGIVVEHFLEMGRKPALVDRIARKTAAEMIVDATLADALESEVHRTEIPRLAAAHAGPPQEFQHHRLREFRR